VTVREQTEWMETVNAGWNVVVGTDAARIVSAVRTFSPPANRPCIYGEKGAAQRCVDVLGCMGIGT
jgi:UDP-N-acetylglucosamine 2-epimerase (non-hydrolysing)/UDP-GlcNAc3NAcA epimerase